MDPMNHPHARQTTIRLLIQIPLAAIAAVGIPIMLLVLQEPTRDHVLISVVMVPICIFSFIIGIRELKRLPHTFRFDDSPEDIR